MTHYLRRHVTEPAVHYEDFHELFIAERRRQGRSRTICLWNLDDCFFQLAVRSHRRVAQNPASGLAMRL